MPYGDGTGPNGMGPRTGRGMGFCAGFDRPGFANAGRGFGRGRRWGRGAGFGRGRRWGFGRGYGFASGPAPAQVPYAEPTKAEEKQMLQEDLKVLKEEIKAVEQRLKELK